MLLNVKNKKFQILSAVLFALFLLNACNNKTPEQQEEEQRRTKDSLTKLRQRRQGDSLKKTNPLLIVPPDSSYTGDYVDKYGPGLTKFKGFFRFGLKHGQWFSFYPTGIKWSEMEFDNGLKHGLNIAYYPTGKKRFEGYYKRDIQDSVWIYYDSTEKIIETHIYKLGQITQRIPGPAADVGKEKKK